MKYKDYVNPKQYIINSSDEWVEKYKVFMGDNDFPQNVKLLPSETTSHVNLSDNTTAYIEYKTIYKSERLLKAIIFHELTHIYDKYIIGKKIKNNSFHIVVCYTEYHAMYIEMMALTGLLSSTDEQKVDLNLKLYDDCTLQKELSNRNKNYITRIHEFAKNKENVSICIYIMYSLGIIEFLNKHCPEGINYFNIKNNFDEWFGANNVNLIQSMLQQYTTDNSIIDYCSLEQISKLVLATVKNGIDKII